MKFIKENHPSHKFIHKDSGSVYYLTIKCSICNIEIDYNENEDIGGYFAHIYLNNKVNNKNDKLFALTCEEIMIKKLLE